MLVTYSHAPRPVGGPVTFALDGDRLTVDSGRKVEDVRLAAVEQVRMTYESRGFRRGPFKQGQIEGRQELPFLLAPLEEPRRGRAPRRAVPRFHAGAARSDRGLQPASPLSRRSAPVDLGGYRSPRRCGPGGDRCSSSAPSGAAIPAPR